MGKPKQAKQNPQWERKKNAIMRNYRKMQKREKHVPNIFENEDFMKGEKDFMKGDKDIMKVDKKTFFTKAMDIYERKKAEKDRIKQIKDEKRKEKEAALKQYMEKKRKNFKKLSKKTKYGQPVMSGRMEILLEKIQKSCARDTIKVEFSIMKGLVSRMFTHRYISLLETCFYLLKKFEKISMSRKKDGCCSSR